METVTGSRGTAVRLAPDMAARVRFVVAYVTARGEDLLLTEGYRPVGAPSDQNARRESDTASGGSTQWFQWGRYQRGETPSAAYPGSSRHGTGVAIDWNAPTARGMALRAEAMYMVGLVANVASESWHAEPLGPVRVDLSKFRTESKPASKGAPALSKDEPMWLANTKDTGRIYLGTAQGFTYLPTIALVGFFRRLIEHHGGNGKEHTFMQKEIDAMNAVLKSNSGSATAAEIAKALAPEISKAVSGLDVKAGASAEDIADEIAKRMAS